MDGHFKAANAKDSAALQVVLTDKTILFEPRIEPLAGKDAIGNMEQAFLNDFDTGAEWVCQSAAWRTRPRACLPRSLHPSRRDHLRPPRRPRRRSGTPPVEGRRRSGSRRDHGAAGPRIPAAIPAPPPPTGFVRIRHAGLFGNHHRHARLARCRAVLGASCMPARPTPAPFAAARSSPAQPAPPPPAPRRRITPCVTATALQSP